MKKLLFAAIVVTALSATAQPVQEQTSQEQAWGRHSKVLALGFGTSKFFHIDDYYYYDPPRDYRRYYWPMTAQINFQGEFGIHDYVGLGFTTGIGGRGHGRGYYRYHYFGELNVPIGLIVNFHFYRLIADNTEKNIRSDKLDIYAGASIGSGLALTYYDNYTRIVPLAFGGVHLGVRYYFAAKVGVNGEVGFGKNLVNIGFVFKL